MILLITFTFFFLGICVGIPLFFAIGLASIFYFTFAGGYPIEVIFQSIQVVSESFPILAVPFFVLAGQLMMEGGAGRRIVKMSDSLVRWFPGGLAIVTVAAAMIFAGITGSLIADVAAIGAIMIPGMNSRGYHRSFSAAVTASSGSIGVIIPPSVPMILYGFIANVSVGNLFVSGILPGILVGLSLMIAAAIIAKSRRYPTEPPVKVRTLIRDLFESLPSIGMLVIILGGIFTGVFTATEAAAVAVVYGLFIGFFVHRELKMKAIPGILMESAIVSATVILVIGAVTAMTWGLTANLVPQRLTMAIVSVTNNKYLILFLINVFLLFLGCVMGLAPALLLTTPLLLPVAESLGINLLHFGLIIVCNLAIGSFTPPVGGGLYVAAQLAGISIWETAKALVPFLIANIIVLMLITYVPEITLLIPRLVGIIP